jgi:hypothetical protein
MVEVKMNSPAIVPPGQRRLAWIAAGILALLGLFAVTAPAQAGYYGEPYYGPHPCSYHCGYGYGYRPYGYYHHCSACGCWHRCYSYSRPPLVYERRVYEREYVVRRYGYGWGHHYDHCCRPHYGYYPYGYHRHYGYYPYEGYRRPFPYGYGGVRDWRTPYGYGGYRYEPSADRYEEPRPPEPVWDGGGYGPVPYGDESAVHWGAGQGDRPLPTPVAAYGIAGVSHALPGGPLAMLASGLLGVLSLGVQ